MFYRHLLKDLELWSLKSNRKPLVLRGARQVGKTTLVKLFAKKYDIFIHLNLDKAEERAIFETDRSFENKLDTIFFLKQKPKLENNTLIFIDEIQNSPEAVKVLRYFYEEAPKIHVIAAGSILETLIDRHISFPVGRVEYMAVRPCSFDEFLGATDEKIAQEVLRQWPIPDFSHTTLQNLFNRYTLIGGMPGVINNYAKSKDLVALNMEFQLLINGYIDDVEKYAPRNSAIQHIRHILRTGFKYGGQRIKFERFGESDYRSREMSEAFRLIEKAMLIEIVYPTNSVMLPWLPNYKKSPRLHWFDTGLLNYAAGVQFEVLSSTDLNSVWRGLVAEHIVGQELIVNDTNVLTQRTFWLREARNSNAEVDFLFPHESRLIPLEVKSNVGTTLKSLHKFMDMAPHKIAVRVWNQPYLVSKMTTSSGKTFKLISIPFYMVSQLEKILNLFLKEVA
jgi:predicted AAA+ superfamily ATPase